MTKKRASTSRKVAAVLAGGLVLGIGAATTLAAWTDSQQAAATFTAGVFKMISSTDGSTWAEHSEGSSARLAVGTVAMSPGISTFGYLDVKTSEGSTLGGTVLLEHATPVQPSDDAMVGALEFRSKALAGKVKCDATVFEGLSFVPVEDDPVGEPQELLPGGDNSVRYCLEIRIMTTKDTNAAQGKRANMIWNVTGTSS